MSDLDASNNSASDTNGTLTSADLAVTKSDSADPVTAGTNLTYTITVKNNGPSDNAGFTVRDVLPAGTSYVSSSVACTNSLGTVSCAPSSLVSGASVVWTITVHVNSNVADATVLSNTAGVFSNNTSDPNAANNSATEPTTVHASADVSVTKTGPSTALAGTSITYTIVVSNAGPSDAALVSLTDPMPAEMTASAASSTQGPCTTGASVICSLGTIAAGASATITVTADIDPNNVGSPSRSVVNTATASSPTSDPNPANNAGSATTTVSRPVVTLGKSVDKAAALNLDTLTYTLSYVASGSTAYDVRLVDHLDVPTTYVAGSATTGTGITTEYSQTGLAGSWFATEA
ncbi:MAG TPA: DUF11 domain-containing protein, partial [Mycobacteriales bacterium]|nr:DUF11 domain-containing protein [Mycobacteriales bacterium]